MCTTFYTPPRSSKSNNKKTNRKLTLPLFLFEIGLTFPYFSLVRESLSKQVVYKDVYTTFFSCECLAYYQTIKTKHQYSASQCMSVFNQSSSFPNPKFLKTPDPLWMGQINNPEGAYPYRAIFRSYDYVGCFPSTTHTKNAAASIPNVNSIGRCHDLCVSWSMSDLGQETLNLVQETLNNYGKC